MSFPAKLFAIGFCLCSFSAQAGEPCYSAKEMVAEQVLRYHSEIMVTTVTCKQGSTGRDLGRAYTGITRRYIRPIQTAEKILMDYFATTYGGTGQDHLDKLRTRLANEFGQVVARESAPAFCARRRDMVTGLYDSRMVSLEDVSLRLYHTVPTSFPACEDAVHVASKYPE